MEKAEVRALLAEGPVKFNFTKADGTLREMNGTTKMEMIPAEEHPTGEGRTSTDEVQTVFDLDKNAWRSFRWDRFGEVL